MAELIQTSPPLIVKVGGSLHQSGALDRVLASIAEADRSLVIVPGGGDFADKVRAMQRFANLSDAQSHRLAILAMHEMADVITSLEPRCEAAATLDEIAAVLRRDRIPVWHPLHLTEHDETLPADWQTTSDAIAARLAERLGRSPLLVVKSIDVDNDLEAATLAENGIVDPMFPAVVERAGLSWRIVGPADYGCLTTIIDVFCRHTHSHTQAGER